MYIGEVAKRTGLSIKAIRFYEAKGLIPPPLRQGNYRLYRDSDLELLSLLAEARQLGIPLARLQGAIRYRNGQVDWQRIQQFLLEVKQQFITEQQRLAEQISRLERCLSALDGCPLNHTS